MHKYWRINKYREKQSEQSTPEMNSISETADFLFCHTITAVKQKKQSVNISRNRDWNKEQIKTYFRKNNY